LPRTVTAISGDDLELFEKFVDMLNELDDVQNIYHDAEY
jgi:transcriptional/translational regulatory protein YebC/TACO1